MADAAGGELDSARGWLVVALGFVSLVLVWGTIFTFTVYAGELAGAFGLSRLAVSSVFSVTTAAFFVAGGGAGVVIARLPLRPVLAAAGVAIGASVALLQVVGSYAGLVAAFGLLGVAGGTVFVVVISLVPQWFDAYEGRAMGVTMTGNGLGVLVLPVVWVRLLGRVDVRTAFVVVGGAAVAVVLAASLVYRRPAGVDPGRVAVDGDWFRGHLADRRFLVALVGYPLLWSWYFVLSSSLVDVLTAAGIARTVAATAFGTIGGISILTRLASGAVADRFGARETLAVGVGLAALGVLALVVTDTRALMYVTLAVFGVGLGAVATLFSPILVGRFGPENATAIVGLFTVAEATTAFGAPIVVNLLVGATGGYAVPLALLALLTLAGAGLFHWGTGPVDAGG
ncbi:MAG: MFS transporter [Halobacteriales archaeon]